MNEFSPKQRTDANRSITSYRERHRCSLPDLLRPLEMEVRRGNLSLFVFAVLVERVEWQEKRHVLKQHEMEWLANARAFLGEFSK
jgi:hypothetical protein